MTDKKLTESEIVKLLECCKKSQCSNCEYSKKCDGYTQVNYALDLITRQQSKIDKLKTELKAMRGAANSLKMHYEEAQAELESLKIFRGYAEKRASDYKTMRDKYLNAKSEAYKEFAEKLKEFMHNKFKALDEYEFEYITERDINNLLKETVGNNNA